MTDSAELWKICSCLCPAAAGAYAGNKKISAGWTFWVYPAAFLLYTKTEGFVTPDKEGMKCEGN